MTAVICIAIILTAFLIISVSIVLILLCVKKCGRERVQLPLVRAKEFEYATQYEEYIGDDPPSFNTVMNTPHSTSTFRPQQQALLHGDQDVFVNEYALT